MSPSSGELWQRISASQLASPMQCRVWAADAAVGLTATESIDATRVAAQLVLQGKLTQFQADVLLSGADERLVKHGWRLLEPVNFGHSRPSDVRSLWSDWWVAAKTPTSPVMWLRWLSAGDLKQSHLRAASPALPLVLRHSQVTHEHLQNVVAPEMVAGSLQLNAAPVAGQLMSGLASEVPITADAVITMLSQVAGALAALHAAGITHGRVTPDRICRKENGQWELLRDPLCANTLDMSNRTLGLLAHRLPAKLSGAHFMAPEFLLPAQSATPQTDCYALGCTAWWMLTGQPPVTGQQAEQILAAHAEQPLALQRIEKVSAPLRRCIVHCLAKNPSSRFTDARQLLESLQEAQRLIAAGPTSPPAANSPAQPVATTRPIAPAQPAVVAQPVAAAQPVSAAQPVVAAQVVVPSATEGKGGDGNLVEAKLTEIKPRAIEVQTAEPASQPNKAATDRQTTIRPATPQPAEVRATSAPAVPVSAPAPTSSTANSSAANSSTGKPIEKLAAQVGPAAVAAAPVVSTPAPVIAAPAPVIATPAQSGAANSAARRAAPAVRSGVRRPGAKRKKSNAWLPSLIGGGAMVVLLLVLLVMNGGLGFSPSKNAQSKKEVNSGPIEHTDNNANSAAQQPEITAAPIDSRAEFFELVDSSPSALWAPPRAPQPLALDLLPPGGQLFISLRPNQLFARSESKQLLSLFDADIAPFWQWLYEETGFAAEALDEVVVGAYPGQSGAPHYALRVHLKSAQTLLQLKTAWKATSETKVGDQVMLTGGGRAYYVASQPLVDSQSVTDFVVGPAELIGEAVEMQGAAAPLTSQLEQLWAWTDRTADVCILSNPSFLFTDGRQLIERSPARLSDQLKKWLSTDMRGAMLSTSFGNQWYYELRLIGASDRDAGMIQQKLSDQLQSLPQDVESWFVNQSPHPYWRALALRYPNMLRALASQSRVGVENGQAIANGYLPIRAAPNLLVASWTALQASATVAEGSPQSVGVAAAAQTLLTPEQILDRPITVVVDQQGIEVVLQLIGEQANDRLPSGTKPLRFELDGAAFQRSGFTRNKQIRDFKIEAQPVRVALTELAKHGNPVSATDLSSDEQKLIWVTVPSLDKPDETLVLLTSREAATAAKQTLPTEFAKPE